VHRVLPVLAQALGGGEVEGGGGWVASFAAVGVFGSEYTAARLYWNQIRSNIVTTYPPTYLHTY
jgi:hypothetical protein